MEVFKYFPHVSANLQFLCLSCEDLFVLACSSVALNTCMAYIYIYRCHVCRKTPLASCCERCCFVPGCMRA